MKKLLLLTIWLPITTLTLISSVFFYSYRYDLHHHQKVINQTREKVKKLKENYQMYTSVPNVLGASSAKIKKEDAVPVAVRQYFEKYDSPMLGTEDSLVSTARRHGVDPFLMVAIAQCESNLGKKMPPDCHNPFGWGIHSEGTLCFNNWQQCYEAVASGLKENYGDLMHNPEKMMAKYTPPSLEKGGPWAKCVKQFLDELQ